jgi:hypothetical protein
MPIAYNDRTGEALRLDDAGAWVETKIAENPQTGERLAFDGGGWVPVGAKAEAKAEGPPDRGILGGINNIVGGVADAITQGATFGFSDEIGAGGRALARGATNLIQGKDADLGGNYDRALEDIRSRDKQFAEEHPVASTVGNVAGGLLGARPQIIGPGAVSVAPVTGAAASNSIPRAVGASAAMGAGYGALGGFGAGEGGFENRMASAGGGAMLGGLLGGALPVVGSGVNQTAGFLKNVTGMNNPRNTALDHLGRALRRDNVTPGQVEADLGAQFHPDPSIAKTQRIAMGQEPGNQAVAQRSLEALGIPLPSTKPMAIVDATGEGLATTATQRLGRTVETIPGPGSTRAHQFLQDRQLGQVDRVGADIGRHLSGEDFHKTLDDLDKTRRVQAAPLYDEAYQQPLVWNATIETLIDRPSTRQALSRARTIAAEEGRDPTGLGLDLDDAGNTAINKTAASMQTLDYVKRGLDDVLETFRDKTTGKLRLDEGGRAIDATRRNFVSAVDALNPKYAEARKAWGGPTQTMEAARLGRQYANGDAEVTLKRFGDLSEGDKTAFRLGVARELAGKVENTRDGHNAVNKIFGSKGQRSRLQALFPDAQSFAAFEKAMAEELRMADTRRIVTGGSATKRIEAEQDDAGALSRAALDYAGGGVKGVLFGLANRAVSKARGINEASADELSKMLFSTDRSVQQRALAEVRLRQRQIANRAARGVQGVMAGTAGTANLLGQALATDE